MAKENLDSTNVQILDGTLAESTTNLGSALGLPGRLTTGEGGPGFLKEVDDYIVNTASGIGTTGSTYRMCRFPTNAKVKSLILDLNSLEAATSGAATLAMSVNVAFSDSVYDGTTAANIGLLPSSNLDGTAVAATSASANALFGSVTATGNTALLSSGSLHNFEAMWNGSVRGWALAGRQTPLFDFFAFVDTQGDAVDPGGFFDILFYVSAAAHTGATGYIGAKLSYVQ